MTGLIEERTCGALKSRNSYIKTSTSKSLRLCSYSKVSQQSVHLGIPETNTHIVRLTDEGCDLVNILARFCCEVIASGDEQNAETTAADLLTVSALSAQYLKESTFNSRFEVAQRQSLFKGRWNIRGHSLRNSQPWYQHSAFDSLEYFQHFI